MKVKSSLETADHGVQICRVLTEMFWSKLPRRQYSLDDREKVYPSLTSVWRLLILTSSSSFQSSLSAGFEAISSG